ncbi:MAG: NADPH-dependent F420 reductase [Iphinoe sp. HA4291-MV1]|jgi:hypothetical protein|nr:NADPH-dependent F420 reductase [Iphinoe sp. HA4291-MV1]
MRIGFIGVGNVATNLGKLFDQAGHNVIYGSRHPSEDKKKLETVFNKEVEVDNFETAAKKSDVLIFAIPYSAVKEVAESIKDQLDGKVVVDLTNPLNSDWSPVLLGVENSGGEEMAKLLPNAKVVKAFNTIFADMMKAEKLSFGDANLTAFICGNDSNANQTVADLASDAGFAPLIVGDIKNARYLEAIAHLNIQIAIGMKGGTDAGFKFFQR